MIECIDLTDSAYFISVKSLSTKDFDKLVYDCVQKEFEGKKFFPMRNFECNVKEINALRELRKIQIVREYEFDEQ